MPASALTPQAAVERLDAMSSEVRAAVLLDERGELAARAGAETVEANELGELAARLFETADAAAGRAGVDSVSKLEVSRREGGVFGVRRRDAADRLWTLVAVTAGGVLSSLVLYDLRMTLISMESAA